MGRPIKPADFIAMNRVFRFDQFRRAHAEMGASPQTTTALLRYYVSSGRLKKIRRGVYAHDELADPFVLASRLATDAVLAYDGALAFHDLHPLMNSISYLTKARASVFLRDEIFFTPVRVPLPLFEKWDWGGSILTVEHGGQTLKVTSRERTLVDCLDRLDLSHGPRALWDSFCVNPVDTDVMIEHAKSLKNRLVVGRLAVFFESMGATNALLNGLDAFAPRSVCYFDPNDHRKGGELFPRWSVIVPERLIRHIHSNAKRNPRIDFDDEYDPDD